MVNALNIAIIVETTDVMENLYTTTTLVSRIEILNLSVSELS